MLAGPQGLAALNPSAFLTHIPVICGAKFMPWCTTTATDRAQAKSMSFNMLHPATWGSPAAQRHIPHHVLGEKVGGAWQQAPCILLQTVFVAGLLALAASKLELGHWLLQLSRQSITFHH
jgi:hypothetical protein